MALFDAAAALVTDSSPVGRSSGQFNDTNLLDDKDLDALKNRSPLICTPEISSLREDEPTRNAASKFK